MRVLKYLPSSTLIVILLLFFAADSQSQELKLQKVTKHLYMISGGGGNVAFLVTEEGVLVVDSMSSPNQGKELVAKIQQVTDKPIKYLIYTHHHLDHVLGSQSFPTSIEIISHKNTLKNMKNFILPMMQEYISKRFPQNINELEQKIEKLRAEKSPELEMAEKELEQTREEFEEYKKTKVIFPEITFEKRSSIHLGDKEVKLFYMGTAHSAGDTIVYFAEEKAVHVGDLLFHNMIGCLNSGPFSSENWIIILEKVAEMDIEKVIPGHGELTDKKGLLAWAEYLKDLRAEVKKFILEGASLEETKAKLKLPKYQKMSGYERCLLRNTEAVYLEMTSKKKSE